MQPRNRARSLGKPPLYAALGAFCLALLAPTAARAEVTSGSSTGYGIFVDVDVLSSVLALNAGPASISSGSAPPAYNDVDSLPSLSVSTLLGSVTTGVLNSSASSNIDGTLGSKNVNAAGSVDNLNLSLGVLVNVLQVQASVIGSTTTVSGDFGVLNANSTSTLTGLTISVLGVPLSIPLNPAPNTGLSVALAGLSIILNEQITTPTANSLKRETNALAIRLTNVNVAGIGILNGTILVGHSEAIMFAQADPPPAVPEPSSIALLGVGAGLVGGRHWLKRRKARSRVA